MHILFVHKNFPAQFGHIASYLVKDYGYRCSFVSELESARIAGIERIQYKLQGAATHHSHYCSRTFENAIWHTHAVYEALAQRPDIQPDLVVGHSGFGSTLFLRDLYEAPIINYFEYFYRPYDSDMDFRPEFPTQQIDKLRARARNAMLLLDLENCDAGYSPTSWQSARLPDAFRPKLDVIFDGIDTTVWHPVSDPVREFGGVHVPEGTKLVTYVSRGMESMRGFDIFMKVAKRLCDERSDVMFLVVGEDRVCYGGDLKHTEGKSFKDWVLSQDDYDLSRIHFIGRLPPPQLAQMLSLSNLHIYLTVPFVLSWSLMNALACGAVVIGSNTGPVQEMVRPGETGLLVDFYDIDGWVETANRVLDDPAGHQPLAETAAKMISEQYSLEVCLPKMLELYQRVLETES